MASAGNLTTIIEQLKAYKRKYYLNKLLKGVILFFAIILSTYLIISSAEYTGQFNSPLRTFLFFSFVAVCLFILYKFIVDPIVSLLDAKRQINDEEAARQIGGYFPEIKDKLLNYIQLQSRGEVSNELIAASIAQRTKDLSIFSFPVAIHLDDNVKYLKYLVPPAIGIFLLIIFMPQIFTESNKRIIQFNKDFIPQAPFAFNLQNSQPLLAFRNEDYAIKLELEGNAIPANAYLIAGDRRVKLQETENGIFEFTFQNIQRDIEFYVEAAGFNSDNYNVKVVDRPNLKNFNVNLNYPSYLNKKSENLNNVGNLQIPEGTEVSWQFNTLASDSLWLFFQDAQESHTLEKDNSNSFKFKKQILESDNYRVQLRNQYSQNKQAIQYYLDVIPDQNPSITLEQFQDTTLYKFMILGGNISDDYGLTRLALYYQVNNVNNQEEAKFNRINLPLNSNENNQSYYYRWTTDSFNLAPGDKINYFLQVWDNDGVNGAKSSKTGTYSFSIPSREEIKESLNQSNNQTQSQISNSVQKAQEFNKQLNEAEQKLRGKKEMNWQDKQMLEDLIKKREELSKEIQDLQEQSLANKMKQEQFSEHDEKTQQQIEQLQNLMDELLDEKTKAMYEELKKLLEDQKNIDEIQNKLSELNNSEETLKEELERALELFKRMKFDMKLDEVVKDLNDFKEEQEQLSEKTDSKENDSEELSKEQESLNEKFEEEMQKSLEELNEINQDLKNPNPIQDFSQEEQQIKEEQQKAKEALDQNKRNKAKQSQQKSSEQMQKMSEKLQQMQQSMEMEMLQENIDNLRNILDNLVTLSFNQEDVLKSFREVRQNDPRFIDLSQQQLKLRDDAQIIEDSLMALAERVFQIQSFVTREVKEMNKNMEESMDALKERQQFKAISKQQFSMTSINNLALLLNDVLSQMQQQMADAMGNPKNQKNNPSNGSPSLSELQKQLNEQIQQLKKSGKSGRELSEELAKMAAQQERIRKALQQMEEKTKNQDGGNGDGGIEELKKEMEQTEMDLVNKKLSSEMQKRQKQIMTRLLEAEKSLREQELDKERKGETAKDDYDKISTESFDEYIKTKQQEIDLLKTVPVKLNPYYKSEANKYFKRINE